jgi:hypothetical protein
VTCDRTGKKPQATYVTAWSALACTPPAPSSPPPPAAPSPQPPPGEGGRRPQRGCPAIAIRCHRTAGALYFRNGPSQRNKLCQPLACCDTWALLFACFELARIKKIHFNYRYTGTCPQWCKPARSIMWSNPPHALLSQNIRAYSVAALVLLRKRYSASDRGP